ncbi:DUF4240 domain-containing protein [Streptomyces sp. NPDC000410]|uniref:DUF4240 domain-containing protein n=1 Tax=Streptomyces sp. NPDC000410 TaxID=3154254 RepID=UPI003331EB7D
MDTETFWHVIDEARHQVADATDGEAVAAHAAALLARHPRGEIVAAQQIFWDLMAASYRSPLWAAAYMINGGCSDDGFDYFRGWLIVQGRDVFERAVSDPDTLADHPALRAAEAAGMDLECEAALGIAWDAHLAATGEELPADAFTIRYPDLDPDWDEAFQDDEEAARRLPGLAAIYLD